MLGVTEDHFWDSCPTDLQPYVKMDEMYQKRLDAQMWQMGLYVNNAVYAAVQTALQGNKAHAQYIEMPLTQMQERDNQKSDFEKFSAWAGAYNYDFENRRN